MNYIQKPKLFRFNLYRSLLALICFSFFTQEAHAGLEKAKGLLETIKSEILTIVPIIAATALILLGIGYAAGSVQKETFIKWLVGLLIVGSAAKITEMILG